MSGKILREIQDLTHLSWSKIRNSSGTAGSFLKAYDDTASRKKYFKMSNFSTEKGIIGHESVNEIIVDRLLSILGVPHIEYSLLNAEVTVDGRKYRTYICMSEDFKEIGESKMALDTYFQAEHHPNENMLDFCVRNGWGNYIYEMLIVDFLILNRDRHGANIEVLRNKSQKTVRLAPLFDHGLSLIFSSLRKEDVVKTDVMRDLRVQCCVGSNSVQENLNLIPQNKMPKLNALTEKDKTMLMEDLEGILPVLWQDKIWEMIWRRWMFYESFCSKR